MRIALTCPASLPATQFGGIMFLCVHLAKKISNIGHDVTICTTDLDFANNPKTFNKNLLRLEVIEKFKIQRSHVWLSFYLFYINPGMYFQMLKGNYDIIHSVGIRSFQSFVAALVSKRKKIPLVISDQGGLTTHPDLQESGLLKIFLIKIQALMINFILKQATKIIAANEYEKKIFAKFCNEDKITIVRNGIDLEDLISNTLDFKGKYGLGNFILFVGRFNKVKGIDTLLNAINVIKDSKELSNVKLVIMGVDFGFESEMFDMINKLKINDKILVIKNPSRIDVISAYKEAIFLVLPSRWELSPLTPLEGFAFKKPVISTNVHGIPFTVKDKENALLVDPEDYNALAKAIIELLDDNKKCLEYGLNGYKLVNEECNADVMAKNTLKVYQEIINL